MIKNRICTLLSVLLLTTVASASIVNTKHNLSQSGPGNIKASSENEVCIFCHTPHYAQAGKPLWNRSMPTGNYQMYNSEYLQRLKYPTAENLGLGNNTPGTLSRQCLSCHDGTVALGDVYIVRGNILGNSLIDMTGVNADGTMPVNSAANFGTDLSTHHPVGFEYNPNITKNFDSGSKTSELKPTPDDPIKLYTYNGKQYIECSSCHDPHTENQMFLRVHSGSNLGQNINTTCTACHQKDNWQGSVHQTTTALYSDPALLTKYGTNSVSALGCINCHTPHNGQGKPYLLHKIEQNTCFQGASGDGSTTACHGSGGAKDIESVLTRTFAHPVTQIDGVHTDMDTLYGTGVQREPAGSKGLSWSDSKHAECMDCHNQHQARAGTHTTDGEIYPAIPTNRVSNTLKGVSGVEPVWSARWTQPTSFTTMESADKEYQICLKCHSYWALDSATQGVSSHFLMSEGIYATDQAWEFNPNNRSAHPVVMPLNSMPGSYEPKALDAAHLLPPWNANPGGTTMYCSDCHGADNEIGGDPKGPHGSSYNFMLKGENKYWPTKPDGTLYTVGDIFNGGDAGLFCKNCHDLTTANVHQFKGNGGGGGRGGGGRGNFSNITCVECHVAVPHGSPVSRLIGYDSFPEPYNYQGNSLKLNGYLKSSGMSRFNASSSSSACRCHRRGGATYDSYP